MPLPPDVSTVRLYGTYTDLDGDPAQGHVKFFPTTQLHDTAFDTLILPTVVEVELDEDGFFEVDLPATDDPSITPGGWAYHVVEEMGGFSRHFVMFAPVAVDIDVTGATPLFPPEYVASVGGTPGPPGSPGPPGPGLYDYAVDNGFVGTEEQFLDSQIQRTLAQAIKTDTSFSTQSTTPVNVTGLSITFDVPDGPYKVEFVGHGYFDLTNTVRTASFGITCSTNTALRFGSETVLNGAVTGTQLQVGPVYAAILVPNSLHAPTVGASVTYTAQMYVSNAAAHANLIAGAWFGVMAAPFLRAERV